MDNGLNQSLSELSKKLIEGHCTSLDLVEASLQRIAALDNPEQPVFLELFADNAKAAAIEVDTARQRGQKVAPYAGIPFAIKDLFDLGGFTTTAGSKVLRGASVASQSADVVQSLIDAGMVLIGKTNMTEFAFSGLGLNPHYGTPPAWGTRGDSACAPGGSSSGAGVSIAAGMVPLSLGTDTAGSCRIPAAWNGVVGFKPSQSAVSGRGAFPLSPLFDTPGPLTHRVNCCHTAFQLMASIPLSELPVVPLERMRFALPLGLPLDALDPLVEELFYQTVETIKSAGASIESIAVPEYDLAGDIFKSAPMATFEAWAIHRERLQQQSELYDPFVALRVSTGEKISEQTQAKNLSKRLQAIDGFKKRMQPYDALLMPTTACLAPLLSPLQADLDLFAATNGLALRNTSLSNFVDGCAISIPCHRADDPAVGFSLCHSAEQDNKLLAAALAVESAIKPSPDISSLP